MINFNQISYIERKLFNYLKNNNFVHGYKKVKYLNDFFEVYKRIEIQRLIMLHKLYKLKKNNDYYYKYGMLIKNHYLFELVYMKNYYLDKIYEFKLYKLII